MRVFSAVVAVVGVLSSAACEGLGDDPSEQEWDVVSPTVAWGSIDGAAVILFSWHEAGDEARGRFYTIGEDGAGLTLLRPPTSDTYETSPLVSPDGTRIAYSAALDGSKVRHFELLTADLDGTDYVRLTTDDTGQHMPGWSPDGTRLAFTARYEVRTMAVDGSDVRTIARDLAGEGEPAWSPDGMRLAVRGYPVEGYGYEPRLYIVAADGSSLDQVAESAGRPQWSPDGRRVAYARERIDHVRIIEVLDVDDGTATQLIHQWRFDAFAWSPDGAEILVGSYYLAFGWDVVSERGLFAVSADGDGSTRRVTPENAVHALAWSPDGKRIAVLTNPSRALAGDIDALVYTVAADGSDLRVLARAGPDGPVEATVEEQADEAATPGERQEPWSRLTFGVVVVMGSIIIGGSAWAAIRARRNGMPRRDAARRGE